MKRRSFLKILAGAACAVAAGVSLALPEDAQPVSKVLVPNPTGIKVNPAWVNAEYEVGFIFHPKAFERLQRGGIGWRIEKRKGYKGTPFVGPDPELRFNEKDEKGNPIYIPAFIEPDPDYDALDEERYLEYLREA